MANGHEKIEGGAAAAATGSPVVEWQKGVLRVRDKDDLDCTDCYVLTIDGRTVLRAIVPSHGLGLPVSDADRKLIGQALADYLTCARATITAQSDRIGEILAALERQNQEVERLRNSIRSFATDFERISWGWDGDCGSAALVDHLFSQIEPNTKIADA
jgi:hypothetical protein